MKIVIRNGVAIFTELGYLPYKDTPVTVDFGGLDLTGLEVSAKINNLPSRLVKENTIILPESELHKPTIAINLTVTDVRQNISTTYKMDPVSIRTAALLGPDVFEQYPATLKTLLTEVDKLKQLFILMGEGLIEMSKKGDIGL